VRFGWFAGGNSRRDLKVKAPRFGLRVRGHQPLVGSPCEYLADRHAAQ
jgi:hypothetical protein